MDIYKYLIDDVVAPPKVEPIVKREDAEGLMSMRNRQAAAAKVVPDVKSSAVGTIARLYNKIIQEQIKDAKGNVVFDKGMAYSPVSYSANSDGIQDITSAGHDFDRVLRDSLRAGSLVSSTPRRDVKSEILTKIEHELSNDIGERQKTLSPLVSLALGNVTKADRDFRRYIDIKQGQGYGVEAFGSGNVFTNDEDKKEFAAADNLTESLERALDLQKEASSGVEVGDAKDSNVTQSVQGLGARPEVEDDPTVEGAVSEELQRSQERGGSQDNVDAVEAYSEEVKQAQTVLTDLGFKPRGIDGKMGGGTARALRKLQKANDLPITGVLDVESATLINSGNAVAYPDPPEPNAEVEDILPADFDIFKTEIGKIESSNRYNIMGGAYDHYVGRYQMGRDALKDVGRKYTDKLNKALLNNPKEQDRLFKAYTTKNHTHLTKNSQAYRDMSPQEKLGILGYAHNQGATAAEEYLFTGIIGTDANDTKGTKYTDALATAFEGILSESKRPRARPAGLGN